MNKKTKPTFQRELLSEVLSEYMQRADIGLTELAQLSKLPKQSINNWVTGATRHAKQWQPLIQIATSLGLNSRDTNRLLAASGRPSTDEIRQLKLSESDQLIFVAWQSALETAKLANAPLLTSMSYPNAPNASVSSTKKALRSGNAHVWLEDIRRLPNPLKKSFYGRRDELDEITQLWDVGETNVIALVGMGGEGKSALTFHWLQQMQRQAYRGAEAVFVWSFYSQGTTERITSAGEFIDEALRSFGDPDPSFGSPQARGERLARLIGQRRTLLILDGLEPLQYPPLSYNGGGIKDKSLQALLKSLVYHNQGMCLITTRVSVRDLQVFESPQVVLKNLSSLSPTAGAELLRDLGIAGRPEELQIAVREYNGHALALTLLASYINRRSMDRHIRERDTIGALERDPRQGGHARRVMRTYESWFNQEELATLSMLGLFDRPADRGSIEALMAEPAIPEFTDVLINMSDTRWIKVRADLQHAGFLPEEAVHTNYNFLDTHPLVREHFGERLFELQPAAWRDGNQRIFEHLSRSAPPLPGSLDEMSPLYAAVFHGTRAGTFPAALSVYRNRILQSESFFSTLALGATTDDVAALANFFTEPWSRVVTGLSNEEEAFIYRQVGWCLRSLGRLTEAAQCLRTSLVLLEKQKSWKDAAVTSGLVGHINMTTGHFDVAMEFGQRAVELADRSGDMPQRIFRRTSLAYFCNQTSLLDLAGSLLQQVQTLPLPPFERDFPTMYAYSLFHYCDYYEALGDYESMYTSIQRCESFVRENYEGVGELARGLPYLALGRHDLHTQGKRYSYKLSEKETKEHKTLIHDVANASYMNTKSNLEVALEHIRLSDRQDCIALGLLANAELYRRLEKYEMARQCLNETLQITTATGMSLFTADAHLGYARLALSNRDVSSTLLSLSSAKDQIHRTQYGRRRNDLDQIERELAKFQG